MSAFDDPAYFGRLNAETYDRGLRTTPEPGEIDFLVTLAGNGRALELAIGTGRVGVPLAQRGVDVVGLEASPLMVEKLRAKPGGADLPVVIGDMKDVPVEGKFRVAYLVYNTIINLADEAKQYECFRNVARVLEPGGAFVIECYVPGRDKADAPRAVALADGLDMQPMVVEEDVVRFELVNVDTAAQRILHQRLTFPLDGVVTMVPHLERYVFPADLDAMAEAAGLELTERYADWERTPFGEDSPGHVSVWRKPA